MYRLPRPDDILFRYCVMAKGVSRDNQNELVQEIIQEATGEELATLSTIAQQVSTMSEEILELFENSLALIPDHRWTASDARTSPWMSQNL